MAEVIHRYIGVGKRKKERDSDPHRKAANERMQQNAIANRKLINERIHSTATKRMQAELLLAKARGEVILKDLVEKQASYLLVNMRQKILNIPSTYSRRLLGVTDIQAMQTLLREMSISILNELKDMPKKITDPNWLNTLEEGGDNGDSV